MKVEVNILQFTLPNYVKVSITGLEPTSIDAGALTDEQARVYWNEMADLWMEHVEHRRSQLGKDGK